MCHVCSGVCGDNSDFEANIYLDEVQPLSNNVDTNVNDDEDDPEHAINVREFARKFEENNIHHVTNHVSNHVTPDSDERTMLSNVTDVSVNYEANNISESNTVYKKKYTAPPIPPKPTVPVMIHSQPSSKKNSVTDPPPYGLFATSSNSTPYRTSSCTPDSDSPSRSIIAPKRKPPPPPPPPKPSILSEDEFLEQLPPPRDSMLPPDINNFRDSLIDSILPPPPTESYLSDDSFRPETDTSFRPETDNYLSDCD